MLAQKCTALVFLLAHLPKDSRERQVSMTANELIQLSDRSDRCQAVLLSQPTVPNDLGAHGGYRLATLVLGCRGVRIYEAISGTTQYPSGHHIHIALSFEEMDCLIEAYKWHRLALKTQ